MELPCDPQASGPFGSALTVGVVASGSVPRGLSAGSKFTRMRFEDNAVTMLSANGAGTSSPHHWDLLNVAMLVMPQPLSKARCLNPDSSTAKASP